MPYLYETHLHTSQGSSCGRSRGREYVQKYLDLGYTGIIITDHFFNGNTAADRNLPWKKWVERFCRGYEDALEEGYRRGLDVFFGLEETFAGDDYLVYGLDKEWLLEHPEAAGWTRKQLCEEVRRYGGCVVQAHPFRQYNYIESICLSGCVDAVEAANAGNERSFDALAWAYCKKLNVAATAGSDIHLAMDIRGDVVFGVYLDKKMETIADYVSAVRNKDIQGLRVPAGRFDLYGYEKVLLPLDIRDSDDRKKKKKLAEFLEL
jgi:hypothetical protein